MTSRHVYVDESKAGDYLLAAATVMPGDIDMTRRALNSLLLGGQSRLHMVRESDARRRQMLSTMASLGVSATIYRAARGSAKTEIELRGRCLDALVHDLAPLGGSQIVLELDVSLERRDLARLFQAVQREGRERSLKYRHEKASQEPLLAIPDAVAWAWSRGRDWRRRAAEFVLEVRDV